MIVVTFAIIHINIEHTLIVFFYNYNYQNIYLLIKKHIKMFSF